MKFRVWDKGFYESKSRFFAHEHEQFGSFEAENEADLKSQLRLKRWTNKAR